MCIYNIPHLEVQGTYNWLITLLISQLGFIGELQLQSCIGPPETP